MPRTEAWWLLRGAADLADGSVRDLLLAAQQVLAPACVPMEYRGGAPAAKLAMEWRETHGA